MRVMHMAIAKVENSAQVLSCYLSLSMPGANTLAYWCAMSVTKEKGFMALSAEIEYLGFDPTVCLNQEPKPTYRSVS
jgi:hypothetical protein